MKVRLRDVRTDRTVLGVVTKHKQMFVHLHITQKDNTVFAPGQFNGVPQGELVENGVGRLNAHLTNYDHPTVNLTCYRPYGIADITGPIYGVPVFDEIMEVADAHNGLNIIALTEAGRVNGHLVTHAGVAVSQVNFGPGPQLVPSYSLRLNAGIAEEDFGAPIVLQEDEEVLVGMIMNYTVGAARGTLVNCSPAALFHTYQGGPC